MVYHKIISYKLQEDDSILSENSRTQKGNTLYEKCQFFIYFMEVCKRCNYRLQFFMKKKTNILQLCSYTVCRIG